MNRIERIEKQVFNGIRKTINKFREKPFNFFTEADIHSSLINDIMEGGKNYDLLTVPIEAGKNKKKISISLVHQEYPTLFRYKKNDLLKQVSKKRGRTHKKIEQNLEKKYKNTVNETRTEHGTRGHYDLAIINPKFIQDVKEIYNNKFSIEVLKHIINKDIRYKKNRPNKINGGPFSNELLFAIEIKFIHLFNIRHNNMKDEIIKDNVKLKITSIVSNKDTKCINLIFCAAHKGEDDVMNKIKKYIQHEPQKNLFNKLGYLPNSVLNMFIESYIDGEIKKTQKPSENLNSKIEDWAEELVKNKCKKCSKTLFQCQCK